MNAYLPSCGITRALKPCRCLLATVSQASAIDRVIEQNPGDAQAGFVAWQPGELEKEIDPASGTSPTRTPPVLPPRYSRLWEELVQQLGNDLTPQRRAGDCYPQALIYD